MTNTVATAGTRHLVLIDIENLAATPSPTAHDVRRVNTALEAAVPHLTLAQCVVACSHHAARVVAFEYPRARLLWRSGPNGADRALIDVLDHERVDQRFARVTICSGDGVFSDRAARLAEGGADVTVVSLPWALSARLRLAARHVVELQSDRRTPIERVG